MSRPDEGRVDRVGAPQDSRSIPELIRELTVEGQTLVRKEIELAKTEMGEKMSVLSDSASSIGIGAGLALVGAVFLLWAVNMGVTVLFALFVEEGVAVWLAPLVLGGLLLLIGISMAKGGTRAIKEEGVVPNKTVESLKEDTKLLKKELS